MQLDEFLRFRGKPDERPPCQRVHHLLECRITAIQKSSGKDNVLRRKLRLFGQIVPYYDAWAMLSSVEHIQSNAVYAIEFVMTASPTYFRENPNAWDEFEAPKLSNFIKAAAEWAKNYFGENLISMTLHLDQTTPHIHALGIPLLNGKLNCRELYGRKVRLKELQVNYAKVMAPLGLERGAPRVGAKHTARGKWIAEMKTKLAQQAAEIEDRQNALEDERATLTALGERLQAQEVMNARDILQARNAAIIQKERALEDQEKEIRANAQKLGDDAEYIRQLISELKAGRKNVSKSAESHTNSSLSQSHEGWSQSQTQSSRPAYLGRFSPANRHSC